MYVVPIYLGFSSWIQKLILSSERVSAWLAYLFGILFVAAFFNDGMKAIHAQIGFRE